MKSNNLNSNMLNNTSLVIVGSGIKFLSHLSTEAKAYIQQSDSVLYLVNDPAMKEWIKINSTNSTSLDFLYNKYELRADCYNAITEHIISEVKKNQHVCVVLYGHPCVFSQPGINAAIIAKNEGFYSKILPAISAEDCLIADLMIDISAGGCQSFEATDFLIHRRKFDPSSHLILWQTDVIGARDHATNHNNKVGIEVLVDRLCEFYDESHEITLYEAAQYPNFPPKIEKVLLKLLPKYILSPITTLYVPPAYKTSYDPIIASNIGMLK